MVKTENELRQLIKEAILQEIDIQRVPQVFMGVYAFVLAYNVASAAGIFPRHQPINIEFNSKRTVFSNGTLFIDPKETPKRDQFTDGAYHDLLHGLTQNSQPVFGTFKGGAHVPQEDEISTNNRASYQPRMVKRAFEELKSIGIDLSDKLPKMPSSDNKRNFELYLNKIRIELNDLPHPLWQQAFSIWNKYVFYGNYYNHSHKNAKRANPPTHAIEEIIGNFVSDQLGTYLYQSAEIPMSIMPSLEDKFNNYSPVTDAKEFPYYDHETNDQTIDRWVGHLRDVLPKFIKIYNQKLAMLKRTKFGKDSLIF